MANHNFTVGNLTAGAPTLTEVPAKKEETEKKTAEKAEEKKTEDK